jgi:hypothetical protein
MPPGWANLLAVGIDHPLPSSVTLCPEHARALRAQLKNPAQKIDLASRRRMSLWAHSAAREQRARIIGEWLQTEARSLPKTSRLAGSTR